MSVRFSGEGTWLNTHDPRLTAQTFAGHVEWLEDEIAWLRDALAVAQGHYLCEGCWDCMTDDVLAAIESPTGLEMASCPACQEARR